MDAGIAPRGSSARRLVIAAIAAAALVVGALVIADRLGAHLLGGSVAAASPTPGTPAGSPTPGASQPLTPGPTAETATPGPRPTPGPPALVRAPLTGLLVAPDATLRHPVAVMVDDHPDARPQAGFNAASIVWQAPAEGGTPRYMLVFQDQVPASVGPIRSAREYFIEWAAELNAMYVHHGGSPQALDTLRARGHGQWVWNADGFRWEGRYVWRVRDRFAPHNVMTDGAHLRELAVQVGAVDGPAPHAWTFADGAPADARPSGGTIRVEYPYETVEYRYDLATNRYVRYVGDPAHSRRPLALQVDAADGAAVAPTNVVILRMFFGPLNDGHPNKHRLEARDVGKGEAWIATNGHTIKGTWRKDSVTGATLLFGPDGAPVVLAAGQTFVQVLPLTYAFEIHDGRAPTTRDRIFEARDRG